jgi:hypothetical protein
MSYSHVALLTADVDGHAHLMVPKFTTINAAVADILDNTLLLIGPGTYAVGSNLNIGGVKAFVGYGGRPVLSNLNNNFNLLTGADVMLDGLTLRGSSLDWQVMLLVAPPLQLLANRVKIEVPRLNNYALGSYFGNSSVDAGSLQFRHCTLERGYATIVNLRLQNISLYRCYTPNYSTYSTFGSLGSLYADDKALALTDDYGHEFGEPAVRPEDYLCEISSRVLDLRRTGSPRIVLFDWRNPTLFCVPADIDSDGHWSGALVPKNKQFGIYYLSRDQRCPPIIHGPYTAE